MQQAATRLTIRECISGEVLADADAGRFEEIEGNWYVDPSSVDSKHLKTTNHQYRCPYKGRCFCVDFDDGNRRVHRVAWVYDEVNSEWEHIRGKYGFYAGPTARKLGKTLDQTDLPCRPVP